MRQWCGTTYTGIRATREWVWDPMYWGARGRPITYRAVYTRWSLGAWEARGRDGGRMIPRYTVHECVRSRACALWSVYVCCVGEIYTIHATAFSRAVAVLVVRPELVLGS